MAFMSKCHLAAGVVWAVCLLLASPTQGADAKASKGHTLVFDPAAFSLKTSTIDGRTISYRAYEGIVYVRFPVDVQYQCMNIYVPTEYYEGKSIGSYNADTAPIFFPNTVGGYMPGRPGGPGKGFMGGSDAALTALSRGYVVAAPGARGRTNVDARGRYTGKAPAAIVDLKAAVRYLRANDAVMPGNAERIVSNGTSAGGALSALLGATGNNPAYEPYLKALGAAEARDDVYATSAYCPITNLDHADMAYEWLFCGINEYSRGGMPGPRPQGGANPMLPPGEPGGIPSRMPGLQPGAAVKATMNAQQVACSKLLKAQFPAYLNSLGLKAHDGKALTLDAHGDGPFKDHIKSLVIASAQRALEEGKELGALPWVKIQAGVVIDIDFESYLRAVGRMKATAAFDGLDLGTGENSLFGRATVKAKHFTAFGKAHGTVRGTLADPVLVKLMNPMDSIGQRGTTVAKHWRIRHGTQDRDTSLAIPAMLAARLANSGADVDFRLPWAQGHGGDYDLEELFAWIDQACR